MNIPTNLRYTSSHEWVRTEADGTVSIGITDHAQGALGDLVYLELPEVGRKLAAAEACAVVESVKAASDVYSPVSGEVRDGKKVNVSVRAGALKFEVESPKAVSAS
jgi:glycine cleavage system H protein